MNTFTQTSENMQRKLNPQDKPTTVIGTLKCQWKENKSEDPSIWGESHKSEDPSIWDARPAKSCKKIRYPDTIPFPCEL